MRVLLLMYALSFSVCESRTISNDSDKKDHSFLGELIQLGKDLLHGNLAAAVGDLKDTIKHGKEGLLIVPGTNWCGAGSIAKSYDDLGLYVEADTCCREHDNCFDNINAHEEKHGIRNKYSYTMSHCDCDRKFYKCMKAANTTTASRIGFIYFNVLKPKCFIFDFPIIECLKFGESNNKHQDCQQYKQNITQTKVWQTMDAWDWKSTEFKSEENTTASNKIK